MDPANELLQEAMEVSKQLTRMDEKEQARVRSVDVMKRRLKEFADSSTFIVRTTEELEFLRNILDEKPAVSITIPASVSDEDAHHIMQITWPGALINKQTT